MSRQTFEKLGLIDEEYKDGINYEDTDYFLRAYKLGIPFKKVEINLSHWGYKTTGTYFDERTAEEKKSINRNIFFKRWM
jgi:GT2 family glycosyltransferase